MSERKRGERPEAASEAGAPTSTSILFVCLGNICRSPTAEGVMAHLLAEAGRSDEFELDSAGTGGWHVGDPPDERATAAAADRGIELGGSSRKFRHTDFDRFDLIVAMDRSNLADMRAMAEGSADEAKLSLLREHDPEAVAARELDVPDPYYGGEQGFEQVIDVVEAGCRGLLGGLESDGSGR